MRLLKRSLDATGTTGGLVAHLGCGDGRLTAALARHDGFLVLGLDEIADNVAAARELAAKQGLAGKVTIAAWDEPHIPLIDAVARLIVVEPGVDVSEAELLRVATPGGAIVRRAADGWTITAKSRSGDIDQWTHFLRDASGNAVAQDRLVGPPEHMQWWADPLWMRSHHTLASISSVVTTAGRIFYVADEGPSSSMQVPSTWYLVARDAHSGVLLWKQPIPNWAYHLRKFRSGPVQLQRTLVAEGDRVYLPLGITAPLSEIDAASGEVLQTYAGTDATEEILLDDGVLLVVTGAQISEQAMVDPARKAPATFPNEKTIRALDAASGRTLWTRSQAAGKPLMPLTLSAADGRVVFQAGENVIALDRKIGRELWQASPTAAETSSRRSAAGKGKQASQRSLGWSVNTLVLYQDVLLLADGKNLTGMAAARRRNPLAGALLDRIPLAHRRAGGRRAGVDRADLCRRPRPAHGRSEADQHGRRRRLDSGPPPSLLSPEGDRAISLDRQAGDRVHRPWRETSTAGTIGSAASASTASCRPTA